VAADLTAPVGQPLLDLVIPVYNEEADLERSVRRLHAYLAGQFPYEARITIADNASTDGTWRVARRLAAELREVRSLHLDRRGRGRALRAAWMQSDASVVAYMDVDLSTDLNALLPLVAPLVSGHSEVAIGRRLGPGARVVRGPKREVISRGYNLLLRLLLGTRFRDAQCGFKALRADVARRVLPEVEDDGWFFDTELLTLAERAGLRIFEVPVDWTEDEDSRVDLVRTALEDLRGIWRMSRRLARGLALEGVGGLREASPSTDTTRQLWSFGGIGAISTLAYFILYWLLRDVSPAPVANVLALLITAVGNTAANRRLTFGVTGRPMLGWDHTGGLVAFGVALGITTASLAALQAVAPGAGRVVELAVLGAANLVATVARFVLLRTWIYHTRRRPAGVPRARPASPLH
jgi:glycosyltransferase involved in cell wall biosynthesis/putative flippase GtrA